MKCKIFALATIMVICFAGGALFFAWVYIGHGPILESAFEILALLVIFVIFYIHCEVEEEISDYLQCSKKEDFVTVQNGDTKVSFSTTDPIEDGLFDGKMSHKVVLLGTDGLNYTTIRQKEEYIKNLEKNLKNDLPEQNIYAIETKGLTDIYRNNDGIINSPFIDLPNATGLHIYITSDDEINENDWHINRTMNEVDMASRNLSINHKSDGEFGESIRKQYKKIIFTSNINLISDGVEALDNNFYSWFAKNPDSKYIKIISKNVVCTCEEESHGFTTEYAVGDYVSGMYTTGRIKEIKGNVCFIEHYSHTEMISLENINPIPISEEWLLELGYESNPYQDRYELREKGIHVECDKTSGITKLWIFGHPEIKYVHQLQNINSLIKDKISN
jgi:hypothetical protein